jgi:hypothetical protein
MTSERVKELEGKIADLKGRWPRPPHLVPPQMLEQLEELEDELKAAKKADI